MNTAGGIGGASARVVGPFVLFVWCALLLLAPRGFYQNHPRGLGLSDGFIEYEVGRTLLDEGTVALPRDYDRPERTRVVSGVDGRLYAVFGVGNSLLFAATQALDRGARALGIEEADPGFFSTTANAGVTAATAGVLVALLVALGIGPCAAVLAAAAYGFCSMGLSYARLSFNMPLNDLALLAAMLFVVRGANEPESRRRLWAAGGGCFGAALLIRVPSVIFALPIGLYLLGARRGGETRAWLRDAAWFAVAAAPFPLVVLALNAHRFGSPFDTGYTRAVNAFAFNAPLLETLPALLVSPGRGLVWFSPLLVFAAAGVVPLARRRPWAALLVLGAMAMNFVFYASNRAWITAHAWGPRFQLFVVLLASVPLAFWLEAVGLRKRLWRRVFAASFAGVGVLQLALIARPHAAAARFGYEQWIWQRAQIWTSLRRFGGWWSDGGSLAELDLWWAAPHPAGVWAIGALALVGLVLSGARLRRALSESHP